MACSTIQGCARIKITTIYIHVVCIHTVSHWSANRDCWINPGDMVFTKCVNLIVLHLLIQCIWMLTFQLKDWVH